MRVLVVNAGSTSLKLHLVSGDDSAAVDQIVPLDQVYKNIEKRVLYIFGAARVGAL